jgi:hypothetical protein
LPPKEEGSGRERRQGGRKGEERGRITGCRGRYGEVPAIKFVIVIFPCPSTQVKSTVNFTKYDSWKSFSLL